MKQRPGIKKQFIAAWKDCIENDYCNQKINSERSLQASLWSYLYNHLPNNRRLFIEPSFSLKLKGKTKNLYPDIVVCNSKEIIAVIEIKYLPRGKPKYEKDIETLSLLSQHRDKLSISNFRYRGIEADAKEYILSKNILFVWAGIHKSEVVEKPESFANGRKYIEGSYLQLHAATNEGGIPNVYSVI